MLSQLLFDIDPSLFLPHSCLPDIEHLKNMLPVKSDKEAMLGAGLQIRKTRSGKKGTCWKVEMFRFHVNDYCTSFDILLIGGYLFWT